MEPGEDLLRIQQEQDNRDGLDRLVNSLVSQGTPLRGSIRNAVPSTEPFPEAPTVSINKPRVSPLYTNMPDVKAANEAAKAKAAVDASNVTLNTASAEAKKKAADAAMIKANKASS